MLFPLVFYILVIVYISLEMKNKKNTLKARKALEIIILIVFFSVLSPYLFGFVILPPLQFLMPKIFMDATAKLLGWSIEFLDAVFTWTPSFKKHGKHRPGCGCDMIVSIMILFPIFLVSLLPLVSYILSKLSRKKELSKKQKDIWLVSSSIGVVLPFLLWGISWVESQLRQKKLLNKPKKKKIIKNK